MERKYEIYPKNAEGLYYVEFAQWDGQPERYRLFKRNFMYSKKEWDEILEKGKQENPGWDWLMSREVHPWQLHNGDVNQREHAQDFETKAFLKFVVDSLNKNSEVE